MITMGGYSLPSRTIREMIISSIDVVVQAARLRDGSRRITHISEVLGMEGDVIVTQDIFLYDILGEDQNGNLIGRHRSTGITKPQFTERATLLQRGGQPRRGAREVERRAARAAELAEDASMTPLILCPSRHRRRRRRRLRPRAVAAGRSNRADKRMQGAAGRHPGQPPRGQRGAHPRRPPQGNPADAASRRPTLLEKRKKRVPLQDQIFQAGMKIKRGAFIRNSIIVGVVVFVILFVLQVPLLLRLGLRRRRRLPAARDCISAAGARSIQNKFLDELPNAVEAIVRGVKSGLPLNDSMRVVAKEAKEPVKSEFQRVLDQQAVGKSMTEAVPILFDRVPLPEVNFFVVVITVQQQAGGNLTEALGNLVARAAQPQEDEAEGQGHVVGSQGLGRHHRLAALRRRDPRVAHDARPTCCRSSTRRSAMIWLGVAVRPDGHRHLHHEPHDPVRFLGRSTMDISSRLLTSRTS